MAKLLAIEWDSSEIRGVLGRGRGRDGLMIDQAFVVPLSGGGQGSDEAEVGPQLVQAMSMLGVGRCEAVVSVGRANIEMRQLQLPAAPEEELPDMVRFQAMRQFTTIDEDWPLDFVPLARSETSIEVLAAAISPMVLKSIREACQAAHITPRRVVLRPFAAASLLRRSGKASDERVWLVVDVLSSDADLFVMAGGQVVFVRTVRLPHGEGSSTTRAVALLGEMRRTIAAAQSQLGGRRIEGVLLWGEADQHAELTNLIDKQLGLPVECLDPFAVLGTTARDVGVAQELSGRFAPLLGMLADELGQKRPDMDFLAPRKRPEKRGRRERLLLVATGVVAVVCVAVLAIKLQLDAKDRQIAGLRTELKSMEKNVKEATKRAADLKQVERFVETRVPWLDQLHRLSINFPPANDAIVTKLSAALQTNGEGQLTVEGLVADPRLMKEVEAALRDDAHRVFGRATQKVAGSELGWNFHETIQIDPLKLPASKKPTPQKSPSAEQTTQNDGPRNP
jgi:Tfp pilus assembly PilM family ATPase/cell division protein FtsL